MLSEEYKTLFKGDPLVAHIAENLSDFAEVELKEDSLLNVLHRSMDALCDGERAYKIVEKWNTNKADKVDNLTVMVRRQDMPFPCLLDTIYRLHHLCEQNHKIMQK